MIQSKIKKQHIIKYPFTKLEINESKLRQKIRTLKGNFTNQFKQSIQEEVEYQNNLAKEYPDIVLQIESLNFRTSKKKQLKEEAIITYQCDFQCMPIFEYIEQLNQMNTLEKKLQVCIQLFEIAVWIIKTKNTHRNLKPNNLFYYNNKVLLTDFGSKRTFYQNYVADFTKQQKIEWQNNYYFYNTKEYLMQIKDNFDKELFDWSEFQKLEKLIESDIWAIGLIILEIFCSKKEISDKINAEITQNINEYYGMNTRNLEIALNIFEQKTSKVLYQALKDLLNFNYTQIGIEQLKNSIDDIIEKKQFSFQSQNFKINEVNVDIELRIEKQKYVEIQKYQFISVKQFQKSYSIISFSQIIQYTQNKLPTQKYQNDQENQIYSECYNQIDQQMIYETKKKLQSFQNILKKSIDFEKLFKIHDSQIHQHFLCYDTLIYLNKEELNRYQEKLNFVKECYKKQQVKILNIKFSSPEQIISFIDRALKQVEWRIQAIDFMGQNDLSKLELIDLIFYLNDDEYESLIKHNQSYLKQQELNQKQVSFVLEKLKFKEVISKKIIQSFIDGVNEFIFNEYGYISLRTIEKFKNDVLEDIYYQKIKQKKQFGIEQFEFDKSLSLNEKCLEFINKGDHQLILSSYEEFQYVSPNLQKLYIKKLEEKIIELEQNKNLEDLIKYYEAQFWIFKELDYELNVKNFQRQYQVERFIDKSQKQIYVQFLEFFNKMYGGTLSIPKEFGKYLREIDQTDLQNITNFHHQKNQKNGMYFFKNDDNKIIQFGIYRKNECLWTGKFVQDNQDFIHFSKGKLSNPQMLDGQITKFRINHNQQVIIEYKKVMQMKSQELDVDGSLNGEGTLKLYDKYKLFIGNFTNNQLYGEVIIFYDKDQIGWQCGKFSDGKPFGIHYIYENGNIKQRDYNNYCCSIS